MDQTNPLPSVHLSTDSLPVPDRIAIWREVYCRKLFNVEIEPLGDTPFRGEVTLHAVADIRLSHGMRTEAHYRITDGLAQNAADMIGLVAMRTGRAHSIQLGREVMIGADEAIPLATAETLTQTLLDNGRYLGVYVPRLALASMVADLNSALMRPVRADTQGLRLLVDYVSAIQQRDAPLTDALQRAVGTHLCDLMALILGATKDAAVVATMRGRRAARVRQILAQIDRNFADPAFSPDAAASTLGVSPRYIQNLLHETGRSFSERVLELRLQKVRAMLADPRHAGTKISEMAFACGFNEVSYFNQAFRRRFGASPTQLRA